MPRSMQAMFYSLYFMLHKTFIPSLKLQKPQTSLPQIFLRMHTIDLVLLIMIMVWYRINIH